MSKGKFVAVCIIWLVLFGIGAALWRLVVTPMRQEATQKAEQIAQDATMQATAGELPYQQEVSLALDSFSGYAVMRSREFASMLRRRGVKLNLVDDGANYSRRLASLRDGETQMAAFTIDALIKTSAAAGTTPATIVAIIDETQGADAMVAAKSTIRNVDDLNHPDVRFVVTPDSPSETLTRVVLNTFALDKVAANPFVMAKDARDVFELYRQSPKNSRQVFVLWEPYVSEILANEEMGVVIDSSRFNGYIVDCLVADRDFLVKHADVAQAVVESYFQTLYEFRDADAMTNLVIQDAGTESPLTGAMAKKLSEGIRWKNTQENFAHFGLRGDTPVQHIADMIDNITRVLMNTGAIKIDPVAGQPNRLYYEKILRQLSQDGFHPGSETEEIRAAGELEPLSDAQWQSLSPVGTLSVRDLVFPRGTDTLTQPSELTLDELVETLKNWPQYYVIIQGNASLAGNAQANKTLAQSRAIAAEKYLVRHGVSPRRIRAVGVEPSGVSRVTFKLGQSPY